MYICLDQRTSIGCGAANHEDATHCQRCGRGLRFAMHLLDPGTVVGRYRTLNVLGHGGFGAVYEAEDTQHPGFRVALKETFDPATIRSFQGEFDVLSNLQHPHLPSYYEMFEAGENGYLVMELVPGQSLQDVIDKHRGPLLEAQVLGYALQLCDALSYLHNQNPPILHRDIKPANVRLTPDGRVVLVDFGLLKQGGAQIQSSRRGLTPAYAPLEQWGQLGQHTDQRSDLYSLGATLYHLLAGQVPPSATDRITTATDPLPPPYVRNPALSPQVSKAVIWAMALRPPDRPESARAFRVALVGTGVQALQAAAPILPVRPARLPVTSAAPSLPASVAPLGPVAPSVARKRLDALRTLRLALGGLGLLLSLALVVAVGVGIAAVVRGGAPTPTAQATVVVSVVSAPATAQASITPSLVAQPTATSLPALGDTRTRVIDEMVMMYVPRGTFEMGSTEGDSNEQPVHRVTLDEFWIDQYEVTVAQFRAFVQATGHETMAEQEGWAWVQGAGVWQEVNGADWAHPRGPGSIAEDEHPVTQVSWEDARVYCAWVGGQLPTEAQWEYAARGPDGYTYPWGNMFDGTRLNYCDSNCSHDDWKDTAFDDGYADTAPVGSYPSGASWCGALDMAGNVWEWVSDWHGRYPSAAQTNPEGPTSGQHRAVRGGGWDLSQQNVRAIHRGSVTPDASGDSIGFRCSAVVPEF